MACYAASTGHTNIIGSCELGGTGRAILLPRKTSPHRSPSHTKEKSVDSFPSQLSIQLYESDVTPLTAEQHQIH